jgi:hypothetical protein
MSRGIRARLKVLRQTSGTLRRYRGDGCRLQARYALDNTKSRDVRSA